MADWLTLAPPDGGPEPVQKARQVAQELVAALPTDRAALETARVELIEAERRLREQLAEQMRTGGDAVSDTTLIDRARDVIATCERRVEARQLAVQDAMQEFHAAILAARAEWLKTVSAAAAKARTRAQKTLGQLERELDELRRAQGLEWWLGDRGGLDRERPFRGGNLTGARSSARQAKNDDPLQAPELLRWLNEIIEPPPPAVPLAEAQRAVAAAG